MIPFDALDEVCKETIISFRKLTPLIIIVAIMFFLVLVCTIQIALKNDIEILFQEFRSKNIVFLIGFNLKKNQKFLT
jgi:hypothetical protein